MAGTSERKPNWFVRLFRRPPTIPVVRLHGVIAAEQRPGRLNIENVEPLLKRAFDMRAAPAVAIVVNSPGGSPVQSRLISNRIRQLADETGKPVLVFVEDAAASGGYFIAVAGDEIIVDPSSIVGSIGVIAATFGFVDAIEKLGITRRVYTAGKNKSTLDPFLPENADDVARLKAIQREIHDTFITLVKSSRGARLRGEDSFLFSGEYWAGERAVSLGLADAIGDLRAVLRARYGKKVLTPVIAPPTGLLSNVMGRKPGAGALVNASGFPDDLISALETRALWARYGL